MMNAPAAGLSTGGTFNGRYEIVRCIRAGGMGAVYEVVDKKTRRRRALKVMLPSIVSDADFRARFQREATITADIESEHIVETFDADVDAATGAPFIVMELLKGDDLGQILERRGALSAIEAVTLLRQAALALDRTHAAGVIHRDLKPENLFVTRGDDGTPKLKVLDFGIAKVVESTGEVRNTRMLGTPLYMAPEQIRGDVAIGPRVDLYALGHIAFTLLAGEAYWAEDGLGAPAMYALLSRMLLGVQEAPSARAARRTGVALSPELDRWLSRATAAEPSERFDSAGGMIAELAAALGVPGDARAVLADAPPRASAPPTRAVGSTPAEPTKVSGPQGTTPLPSPMGTPDLGSGTIARGGRTTTPVSSESVGTTGATAAPRRTWPIAAAVIGAVSVLGAVALSMRSPGTDAAPSSQPSALLAATNDVATTTSPESPPTATAPSVEPVEPAPTESAQATPPKKEAKPAATVPPRPRTEPAKPKAGGPQTAPKPFDPTLTR